MGVGSVKSVNGNIFDAPVLLSIFFLYDHFRMKKVSAQWALKKTTQLYGDITHTP